MCESYNVLSARERGGLGVIIPGCMPGYYLGSWGREGGYYGAFVSARQ